MTSTSRTISPAQLLQIATTLSTIRAIKLRPPKHHHISLKKYAMMRLVVPRRPTCAVETHTSTQLSHCQTAAFLLFEVDRLLIASRAPIPTFRRSLLAGRVEWRAPNRRLSTSHRRRLASVADVYRHRLHRSIRMDVGDKGRSCLANRCVDGWTDAIFRCKTVAGRRTICQLRLYAH